MEMECNTNTKSRRGAGSNAAAGAGGGLYFVGFIGAAVYYIGHAASFTGGVIGFLKACVWPAFLVYQLLDFLKM